MMAAHPTPAHFTPAHRADAATGELTEMIALKRSAHHAFIEWLCEWKARPTLFINNVFPSDPPRFGQLTVYHPEKVDPDALAGFKSDAGNALKQSEYSALINFEGRSIDNILDFNLTMPRYWGAKQVRCVLFLRDPLNNFSSLTKRIDKTSFNQHLKAFYQTLRFCQYIDEAKRGNGRLFTDVILFTPWQRDESYRRALAERYGLCGSDLKSAVPAFGGGSSFQGQRFDPVKEQEKLFSRWREMRHDPFFLSLFLSDRVFAAVEDYFDMFGDAEHARKDVVGELRREAEANEESRRLCRIWLEGFEKSHAIFDGVERESVSVVRRFWRAYIKSKIGVRRIIYGGFGG
ncbi:MAG: hypothetical protein NW215_09270 [Hyphomicrobiales bacterium]|nr:hypothetical protein [Hyphomicrobiales bacterium]